MSIGWHFGQAQANQKAREPQVEKFFGSDVVANLANALVREGIQNSLDARDDKRIAAGEPVKVRIRLGEIVIAGLVENYTAGLWKHLEAQDDEHLPERPNTALPCQYLAFEDFNTRGLCGAPEQCWPDEDPDNAFFNFFRAEGHSEKREDARGRHGLGKHVFARASRARCFFGLTRRSDDKQLLLLGAAVLRTHKVGANRYMPDGWFGEPRDSDSLVLPVADTGAIATFSEAFDLTRLESDEPGLSIVVPWLDSSIGLDDVIDAVLRGYFQPVMSGQLVVTVFDGNTEPLTIDAITIRAIVQSRTEAVKKEIEPLLGLTAFSLSVPADQFVPAFSSSSKPEWRAGMLTDTAKKELRDDLQAGKKVAVRVFVKVRGKKASALEQSAFFDVFLFRDPACEEGRVIFIREGLIISDARPRAVSGVRAMVVISKGPLATFLGDAENPAHTQWQRSQVEGKYTYPDERIRFVVQSVAAITKLVNADQQTPDPTVWAHLFSIPADEPEIRGKGKKPAKVGPGPTEKPEPPKPKPKAYRIDKTPGGFILRPGAKTAVRPYAVFLSVAYDLRRGDALNAYTDDDFKLDAAPIKIHEKKGVKATVGPARNEMLVTITDDDFELVVEGFGTSRDVITEPKLIPYPSADNDPVMAVGAVSASDGGSEPEVAHANPS